MEAPPMYTSMEVEYDSDEDLQDVGNELTTWLAQLNNDAAACSSKVSFYTINLCNIKMWIFWSV